MRRLLAASCLLIACLSLAVPRAHAAAPPLAVHGTPKHLTIDVFEGDIRNVLRLIADVAGMNLVLGDDVSGLVTVKLKDVDLAQAFRVVLAMKGLEAVRDGNIVMVGTTERMNKQREAQLTRREQCIESAPLHTRIIRLSYANAADMAPHVAATLSKRGSVSVDARTNSLIVRDVDCK